ELSRIRFITKTEIHIFLQARSTIYTSGVIADLLGLPADRVDENDHNLFEIFLTKNPHLTMKTQLTDAFIFIDGISDRLSKISDEVDFRLKINITSFRSNSIRFKLSREFLYKLRDLGNEVEYEFMT